MDNIQVLLSILPTLERLELYPWSELNKSTPEVLDE